MKRIFSALIFTFLSLSAFSVSLEDFSLSIEPLFGMKWGQVDEYVYEKDSSGNYQKESELNWPIKNLFSIGGNIEGGFKKLKTTFHFSAMLPGTSGITEDSDWMDLTDVKTTYSKSENTIKESYDFSVSLKYEFQPVEFIKIAPTAEFEYKTISFEARNGYGWYGHYVTPHVSWDDSSAPYLPKGSLCGIDYTRNVQQFFIGCYFEYQPIQKIKLYESFAISPYSLTESFDTHYSDKESTKGMDYADQVMFYFTRLKASTGFYYVFNDRFDFGLHLSGFYSFFKLGKNYQWNKTTNHWDDMTEKKGVKGGAGGWEIDAKLSCRFKLF